MSILHRVRVEMPPGTQGIGHFGLAVTRVGGEIVSLDIQALDTGVVVLEAVITVPELFDRPATFAAALDVEGAGELRAWEHARDAVDPVLRSMRWACSILNANGVDADDESLRVMREICYTDDVWLYDADNGGAMSVVRQALAKRAPVWVDLAEVADVVQATFCGAGFLLGVPDSRLEPQLVAVVARPSEQPFTNIEIERVEALLSLRRQALNAALAPAPMVGLNESQWLDVSINAI